LFLPRLVRTCAAIERRHVWGGGVRWDGGKRSESQEMEKRAHTVGF
jgi:hypothetical protein